MGQGEITGTPGGLRTSGTADQNRLSTGKSLKKETSAVGNLDNQSIQKETGGGEPRATIREKGNGGS